MGELMDESSNSMDRIHSTTMAAGNETIQNKTQPDSPNNNVVEASFVERNVTSNTKHKDIPSNPNPVGISEEHGNYMTTKETKEFQDNTEEEQSLDFVVGEFNRTNIETMKNTTTITPNTQNYRNQSIIDNSTPEGDLMILEQRLESNRHELYKVSDDVTNSKINVTTLEQNKFRQ